MEQVFSGGLVSVGGSRVWEKGIEEIIWCKYCVQLYVNGKIIRAETIPGIGGIKENDVGDEIKYDIFDMVQEPL
jgi:hypothetical protein